MIFVIEFTKPERFSVCDVKSVVNVYYGCWIELMKFFMKVRQFMRVKNGIPFDWLFKLLFSYELLWYIITTNRIYKWWFALFQCSIYFQWNPFIADKFITNRQIHVFDFIIIRTHHLYAVSPMKTAVNYKQVYGIYWTKFQFMMNQSIEEFKIAFADLIDLEFTGNGNRVL